MESDIRNESDPAVAGNRTVVNTDSADSFQSFIYELFEKNGILNDLRAYLRGHIVNVLKSAETGDPPPCQKNFTQRLDLTYQALNMLVAEYLMRLEFNYSYSIFISEIPLANMVFGFAKSLMANIDENKTDLRFHDSDVWSILNYLGIQCDSEHASKIVEMYKNEKEQPLLLCILKDMPMYNKECVVEPQLSLSEISALSSTKSLDSTENETGIKKNTCMPECSHYAYCKNCQSKVYKLKGEYKKKKKYFAKDLKNKASVCTSPLRSDSLVKNINVVEKTLIDEMFQQLKSVYESEVEMVKIQEEKKVKRSMATHAMQLQQKRNELEETFKAREEELERSIQHKKKFLWGLARSLREQHAHMTRAMHEVRAETERLELKEDSLKTQLAEAEEILKKRGEDMRTQISNELAILEKHLESMKRERENITLERAELENLKMLQDKNVKVSKTHKPENEDVHSHYDLLKNELAILKSYLESSQMRAKCVIERGTITEPNETTSQTTVALNNTQANEKASKTDDFDERVKMNQVVNDFRKKNVNFSQSNLDEIYRERSRDRNRSENSSEAGDNAAPEPEREREPEREHECTREHEHELIQRLRHENDKLRAIARQRSPRPPHVPLPPAPPRPAPAPAPAPPLDTQHTFNFNSSVSGSTVNVGWRKGAGEELSMFSNAQPRILVPGDTLPFIGVLHDRHGNSRRATAGGSRSHTRGALAGVTKRTLSPYRDRHTLVAGSSGLRVTGAKVTAASASKPAEDAAQTSPERLPQRPRQPLSLENRIRDRSPKSAPKDAKDKPKKKDPACRSQSPGSVLREAKLRLRKLEIEADAVERACHDFRRRQTQLRQERERGPADKRDVLAKTIDVTRSHSTQKLDEGTKNNIEEQFVDLQKPVRGDVDKYIHDYKTKFDITETHFHKPTAVDHAVPIPGAYAANSQPVHATENYLDTPLTEFRKLYARHRDNSPTRSAQPDDANSKTEVGYKFSARHDAMRKVKHDKQAELLILKQNLHKIYHSPKSNRDSTAVDPQANQINVTGEDEHNLRVEVESFSETSDIKSQTQDMLVVVQSTVNSREMGREEPSELFAAQMTIIVSPKRPSSDEGRHESPEQAAHLTRRDVLDALFHAGSDNDESSVQMQLELAKDDEDAMSEYDKEEQPAELSAEGERYLSEDARSPISVPATTDDENFWES